VRVAYHSPLPPSRSGIADYSALLVPELARHVELVIPKRGLLARQPRADIALYHVGNDPSAHAGVIEALRRRPGLVVLHDFVLHHLVAGMTLAHGDREGYVSAVEREAGLVGRLLAHAAVDHRILPLWESRPREFPLAFWALDAASGVIVHSRYVEGLVRGARDDLPVWHIPHPAWPLPAIEPARLELPGPLIGCFGHLNESKRIPQLLEAFARLRDGHPRARLLLVGNGSLGLSSLRYGEGVIREQYVPERRLWSLMAACDVVVGLRSPTMGETSGSSIRALCLGKPQVVSDVGWFAELPDEVALRVAPGPGEVGALELALRTLLADDARRAAMGAAAAELARGEHALERVAAAYANVLAEAVERVGAPDERRPTAAGSRA
jgi:glycosyltransferase involved in cell wall biosynthesis